MLEIKCLYVVQLKDVGSWTDFKVPAEGEMFSAQLG